MAPSDHAAQEVELRLLSESSPRSSLSSLLGEDDLEANKPELPKPRPAEIEPEYQTPARIKYAWLSSYMVLAMAMPVHNKVILDKFNCPWLLTAMHGAFSAVGAAILLRLGYFKLSRLSRHDHLVLIVYSMLFSINVFFSNWSLALVSLAFFQIMRNTAPIFTVVVYRLWYSRSYSMAIYVALIPIVLGAVMTAKGDLNYSYIGLIVSITGVILGVIKIIATNRLMTSTIGLGSMELLYRMSIYSMVQTAVVGVVAGELSVFSKAFTDDASDNSPLKVTWVIASLVVNGIVAFALNITSFETNKVAGALAITVAGNLRQTLTLCLGIFIIGNFELNIVTGLGIVLVVVGCGLYSKAELELNKSATSQ